MISQLHPLKTLYVNKPLLLLVKNPACKTEQAIDNYLPEVKAMLMLDFKEKPLQKQDPHATLGRLQLKIMEVGAAMADRESSTFKRKLFVLSVYASRANIESIDLETEDLL